MVFRITVTHDYFGSLALLRRLTSRCYYMLLGPKEKLKTVSENICPKLKGLTDTASL